LDSVHECNKGFAIMGKRHQICFWSILRVKNAIKFRLLLEILGRVTLMDVVRRASKSQPLFHDTIFGKPGRFDGR